jgi:hypothetical protein
MAATMSCMNKEGGPREPGPLGAADCLSLAAAPTFAVMALLTAVLGSPLDKLCSTAPDASPLTGMIPMYVLMSAFHAAPWLKLISNRTSPAGSAPLRGAHGLPDRRQLALSVPKGPARS